MQNEITALDMAIEKPILVGDSVEPEKRWKAVWNIDKNETVAIVSKDYKIVQHRDVATSFIEACSNLNISTRQKLKNYGNRIFIDVEFPDAKLYANKNEEFIAGFRLINSYDKTTGVIIVPRLVRLACMNGMIIDVPGFVKEFHYRHNQQMAENFAGYIEKALKETINSNDKLKAMVNDCISDSVEWGLTERIIESLILTKKHYKGILMVLHQHITDNITRWDIYNAVTEYITHNEQLKPNIEMMLQRKAKKILTTPIIQLSKIVIPEDTTQQYI